MVSNRGPITFEEDERGELQFQRGSGGLVTALSGLAGHVDIAWVACAATEADRSWQGGAIPLFDNGRSVNVHFISPDEQAYDGYYNVISNPLLWFLQHSMWDFVRSPTIDLSTWKAWEYGYVHVNRMFADAVAGLVNKSSRPALVMLQDYHLYLAPRFLRKWIPQNRNVMLSHFVHIPWPGSEDWGMLPSAMRTALLEGLCAVDLLGFQTREDALNFIRTCESLLPGCEVNFKKGHVVYEDHVTCVRDFPISIDVETLERISGSNEVLVYQSFFKNRFDNRQLIIRIDRTEPSKNIIRGFQAFDQMLDLYPEHAGKVQFLALLVPSRLEVHEYQDYLDELMAAAGRVNVKHGDNEWEPVRLLVGENYPRAVAALQMYDVLLVNSIADGMNLVAKEGPVVNQRDGVVVLSERTGARQQLESGAIVIPPCDIYATAKALHLALNMPAGERHTRNMRLKELIEREDIQSWFCKQLEAITELKL